MDKTSSKYYKIRQYFVFRWSEDCLPGRRKKGELQKELQLLAELAASVLLIKALGGGWKSADPPSVNTFNKEFFFLEARRP